MPENKSTKSGIYCIRCTANGKVYVGQAIRLGDRRSWHWNRMRTGTHPNTRVQRVWNKYGADMMFFEILERVDPEGLTEAEQRWIDTLKANRKEYGFNTRPAADSNRGCVRSEETKAKLRAANLGKKKSPECVARMRGKPATDRQRAGLAIGRSGPHSPEHVAKQAAAIRGKPKSEKEQTRLKTARLGTVHSTETRAKMSASHLERHKRLKEQAVASKPARKIQGMLFEL